MSCLRFEIQKDTDFETSLNAQDKLSSKHTENDT